MRRHFVSQTRNRKTIFMWTCTTCNAWVASVPMVSANEFQYFHTCTQCLIAWFVGHNLRSLVPRVVLMAHFVVWINASSAPNLQYKIAMSCLFQFWQQFKYRIPPTLQSSRRHPFTPWMGCHKKQSTFDKSFCQHIYAILELSFWSSSTLNCKSYEWKIEIKKIGFFVDEFSYRMTFEMNKRWIYVWVNCDACLSIVTSIPSDSVAHLPRRRKCVDVIVQPQEQTPPIIIILPLIFTLNRFSVFTIRCVLCVVRSDHNQ